MDVTIPNTERFIINAGYSNRSFQIDVFYPNCSVPENGFPIIYLLDGNSNFATVVDAVRLQSRRPERTNVYPAIVVGIGYQIEQPFSKERFYDYTLSAPEFDISSKWNDRELPPHGGAEEFAGFIKTVLKPFIENKYVVNKQKQTIFGHSLGGLFVLHTLFTNSQAFQTYIVGSPSIHWNQTLLLQERDAFLANNNGMENSVSLLIAAGELEGNHASFMLENARTLTKKLSTVSQLKVDFHIYDNENHISVLPRLINQAIKRALK
ncbi:bacillibactin trilactone hydrolase [Gracilibacillus halophilus YIM-C55.5]|uniref:Bacillibactin trilactone hydrolase n=1 Tax=Gracilibacillus halophilus YIM-C55.5 TaxID=1308866 RepID=N4WYM6_9BACI|nr:alpha/beta hydrolase-fold protein [Gracilibacillus halophilus]ENH98141.1 bacillibactin trilactone hydrolase [Gracilibacillus halophilus YIM-C55.5]